MHPEVGVRWVWWTAVLALVSGCVHLAPRAVTSELHPLLVEADRLWADRGNIGMDPVEDALEAAYAVRPHDPEVLWRLSRLKVSQGLADVDESPRSRLYSFAEARALGIQCLDSDPGFHERRVQQGWELALELLEREHMPCAAWTAMAWARWLEIIGGDAGALDLDPLDQLVWLSTQQGAGEDRQIGTWAQAITMAVRPEWAGRDLRKAGLLLERVIRLEPSDTVRRADLIFLVAVPLGDQAMIDQQLAGIRSMQIVYPEDVAARKRVDSAFQ